MTDPLIDRRLTQISLEFSPDAIGAWRPPWVDRAVESGDSVWLLTSWYGHEMTVLDVFSSHGRATAIADICQKIEDAEAEQELAEVLKEYPDWGANWTREQLRVLERELR